MGNNIDLAGFGICSIRCSQCGEDLFINEFDIDCDLSTHRPMEFELNLGCDNCENCKDYKFKVIEVK